MKHKDRIIELLAVAGVGFVAGLRAAKHSAQTPILQPKPMPTLRHPYKLDPFSRTMRIMGEIVAVGSLAVVLMLWGFVIAM